MTFIPGPKSILATVGVEGAHVWDLATRRVLRRLETNDNDIQCITCSPDGRLLVISQGKNPSTLRLWDWRADRVEKAIAGGTMAQIALFSPDGATLAIGGYRHTPDGGDYYIRRLRVGTWSPQRLLRGHYQQTGFLAFSPDGELLASGAADGYAILWDLSRCEPLVKVKHPTVVWGVVFSPDGKLLATSGGRTIKLIDVANRKLLRGTFRGHKKEVYGIAFTVDGRWLASVGGDGIVRLWDPQTRLAGRAFDWGLGSLHCIAFSPDGMLAAAGSAAGHVVVWDVDD
jgi:WD40 repeat protein